MVLDQINQALEFKSFAKVYLGKNNTAGRNRFMKYLQAAKYQAGMV